MGTVYVFRPVGLDVWEEGPMSLDAFWTYVDHGLKRAASATTVDEVFAIFPGSATGQGFFPGGATLQDALLAAGWRVLWSEGWYHYALLSPDGSEVLVYVEGDLLRGRREKGVNA